MPVLHTTQDQKTFSLICNTNSNKPAAQKKRKKTPYRKIRKIIVKNILKLNSGVKINQISNNTNSIKIKITVVDGRIYYWGWLVCKSLIVVCRVQIFHMCQVDFRSCAGTSLMYKKISLFFFEINTRLLIVSPPWGSRPPTRRTTWAPVQESSEVQQQVQLGPATGLRRLQERTSRPRSDHQAMP